MKSFASLCSNPLVFEPIGSMNSVFYDPANCQARCFLPFIQKCLLSELEVPWESMLSLQGLHKPLTFGWFWLLNPFTIPCRIDDKGEVLSIKFDPHCSILSLQRKRNSVEFINFSNGRPEDLAYSRNSKKSASIIIGFVWSGDSEIIFVTNEGFELYQVNRELRTTKALKQGFVQTNWYNWDPLTKTLLLSTGELGNRLYVTCFENGTVTKLPSFEVPEDEVLPLNHGPSSNTSGETKKLQQKDCLLANL
ncbi:unnamed protein product [Rodentolepis nana]|uniref:ANAPC4_WD40 domain-containing protein n=1 Tax=Rodentolepis nana TaxID=102285 RepID=A0A0R3T8B7_RODNA|nr:unnamed protein product [Rodentolepis nana]